MKSPFKVGDLFLGSVIVKVYDSIDDMPPFPLEHLREAHKRDMKRPMNQILVSNVLGREEMLFKHIQLLQDQLKEKK